MNSNFPYRWSPASLTFNNYFYLFFYLYISWITINNNAPHLKSPKNQNRRAALGRPAIKLLGGGGGGGGGLQLVCGRPTRQAKQSIQILWKKWLMRPFHLSFFLQLNSSVDSRKAVAIYWRKYVHEVLINRLGQVNCG